MADGTHIEWTDATWNPVTGCSVVSPGCTNCYAMKLAGTRLQHHPSRAGLTHETKAGPVWTGEVRLNEEWLTQPLRWRRGRRIFVCAHGDLFHESVPDEWIDRVFAVMALAPQHVFQVLTKRADRMRAYVANASATLDRIVPQALSLYGKGHGTSYQTDLWPLPNLWLGVSVEDQQRADERIPDLLATPAAVRFLSCEPLLGALDLRLVRLSDDLRLDALSGLKWGRMPNRDFWVQAGDYGFDGERGVHRLNWVIAGGESGPGARPMHPDWARRLRDQCEAAGAPFFFKQWGAWAPFDEVPPRAKGWRIIDGQGFAAVGKKAAGRLLDGREHNGMPA